MVSHVAIEALVAFDSLPSESLYLDANAVNKSSTLSTSLVNFMVLLSVEYKTV